MVQLDTSSLGLFDTLVPIASIITISILVGYTLPKHEYFGLFLLLWWTLSVYISLQNVLFTTAGKWSPRDATGILVLLGIPIVVLGILWIWYQREQRLRLFLHRNVPQWTLVALYAYRLDSLSIISLEKGTVPKYLGLQIVILDALIGGGALLLCGWLIADSENFGPMESSSPYILLSTTKRKKDATQWKRYCIFLWNSLGLYDLASAYLILLLNYLDLGGTLVTDPPLSILGFHPLPLIVLFQAPLAMAIHIFLLSFHWEDWQEQKQVYLPLHRL